MGAFLKELRADTRSPVPWVVCLTVAMAVALTGPFGSYGALTISERVLFWTPLVFLAVVVGTVIRAFVYGTLGLQGRVAGSLLSAVLNCAVICPALYALLNSLFPPIFSSASGLFEIVLLVASLSLGVCAIRSAAEPPEAPVKAEGQSAPAAAPRNDLRHEPRLTRRLDEGKRGEIWAISVRDHYVDVHTSLGKTSILMRFSDAIAEVDSLPGAQVHRSHWVAWSGVGSVCREAGKMILHLKNGHQIPASRNNRDKVDARFPIQDAEDPSEAKGAA